MTGKIGLFEESRKIVYEDRYMWCVVWGPPRESKTTIAGHILYNLYKDWNTVLDAFVFNLSGLLYKIRLGVPKRFPTQTTPSHMRVPGLNFDDFGAHSNKASTQHDPAWDKFKGGFDVLGTQIGVLLCTMVDPTEATAQLASKYTHEIKVPRRGYYKFDRVDWRQNYRGMQPYPKKTCLDESTFDPWPDWVYTKYDKMRVGLALEVMQNIEDAITTGQLGVIQRLVKNDDIQLLRLIDQKGPRSKAKIVEKLDEDAIIRCKARALIVPVEQSTRHYKYDLTRLGKDLLDSVKEQEP